MIDFFKKYLKFKIVSIYEHRALENLARTQQKTISDNLCSRIFLDIEIKELKSKIKKYKDHLNLIYSVCENDIKFGSMQGRVFIDMILDGSINRNVNSIYREYKKDD